MKETTRNDIAPAPQEQARLQVLNSVLAEEITIGQPLTQPTFDNSSSFAAELMDLSERHARRLLAAYRERRQPSAPRRW